MIGDQMPRECLVNRRLRGSSGQNATGQQTLGIRKTPSTQNVSQVGVGYPAAQGPSQFSPSTTPTTPTPANSIPAAASNNINSIANSSCNIPQIAQPPPQPQSPLADGSRAEVSARVASGASFYHTSVLYRIFLVRHRLHSKVINGNSVLR